MRVIRLLVAALLLVSAIPMEAFCHDEHCKASPSACAVNCQHVASHNAVVPMAEAQTFAADTSTSSFLSPQRSYENPTISRLKRPPIVLS